MATVSQVGTTAECLIRQIIDHAITQSSSRGRNNAAFSMALQLRDNGFSQAKAESAADEFAEIVGDATFTRREAVDVVRSAYKRPPREPWSQLNSHLSLFSRGAQTGCITHAGRAQEQVDRERIDRALGLWAETELVVGTQGETYYSHRGLDAANLEHAVRFHPNCPFGTERHACVIALIRDVESDEPCGIHRTAITKDGKKIGRRMLGRSANAAVKLSPTTDVTMGLGIGEGIETVLSVAQAGWLPVWAVLSAGSIERFPVLPGIEHLTIWADNDAAGLTSARACAQRWSVSGALATIRVPEGANTDFNDWRAA